MPGLTLNIYRLGKSHSLENSPQVYHFIILNPASSRPPAAVLQHPLTSPRPPPADILSRLQSLTPIKPIMTRLLKTAMKMSATNTFDASEILKEFDNLQSNNVEMEAHVTDTFDEREFLRQTLITMIY